MLGSVVRYDNMDGLKDKVDKFIHAKWKELVAKSGTLKALLKQGPFRVCT